MTLNPFIHKVDTLRLVDDSIDGSAKCFKYFANARSKFEMSFTRNYAAINFVPKSNYMQNTAHEVLNDEVGTVPRGNPGVGKFKFISREIGALQQST